MSDRLNRLLAEASDPQPTKKEIEERVAAALKEAKLTPTGKINVTRSYGFGAEAQVDVARMGGDRVWLEITLNYDGPGPRIELRRRVGSQSTTFAWGAKEIRELGTLIKSLT